MNRQCGFQLTKVSPGTINVCVRSAAHPQSWRRPGEKAHNRPHLAAPLRAILALQRNRQRIQTKPADQARHRQSPGLDLVNDHVEEKLGFDVSNGPAARIECHWPFTILAIGFTRPQRPKALSHRIACAEPRPWRRRTDRTRPTDRRRIAPAQ
jgi:hypothetical protein